MPRKQSLPKAWYWLVCWFFAQPPLSVCIWTQFFSQRPRTTHANADQVEMRRENKTKREIHFRLNSVCDRNSGGAPRCMAVHVIYVPKTATQIMINRLLYIMHANEVRLRRAKETIVNASKRTVANVAQLHGSYIHSASWWRPAGQLL